jgi:cytochrome c-type biogenesis protein CcmH
MAVVVACLLTIGITGSSGARTNSSRIDAIAKQIRCLACPGESVFESRVPFAENVKDEIAREVGKGRTDAEVKQVLVDNHGAAILLLPRAEGANSLLWVLPVAIVLCGGAGLALAFRRWRSEASMVPSDDDRAVVAALLHDDVDGSRPW